MSIIIILNVYEVNVNLSLGVFNILQHISGSDNFIGLENVTEFNEVHQTNLSPSSIRYDKWSNATNSSSSQTVTQLQLVNTSEYEDNDVNTTFDFNCFEYANHENYKVETYLGNITVSFILQENDNAAKTVQFIAARINELQLLAHNISIGKFMVIVYTYFI